MRITWTQLIEKVRTRAPLLGVERVFLNQISFKTTAPLTYMLWPLRHEGEIVAD